jgi:hypothetical protein
MHRTYCDIATRDYPADPLSSPYASSVTTSLRAACALLAIAEATPECMVVLDISPLVWHC